MKPCRKLSKAKSENFYIRVHIPFSLDISKKKTTAALFFWIDLAGESFSFKQQKRNWSGWYCDAWFQCTYLSFCAMEHYTAWHGSLSIPHPLFQHHCMPTDCVQNENYHHYIWTADSAPLPQIMEHHLHVNKHRMIPPKIFLILGTLGLKV
jgi:hypothetical protein